ncbi:galactose mutarotase [Streptomyces sp. ACA25]|uniref:aldose epimerase family protein n=1 Tax=Streptomyces sp. ACA25 TaxID=3022596 RepID=UPI0023076CA5|nr:aldose epimerase family protein [Streptomyces sp. ACA25]MDB1088478.1 galactose mutarotase [Streptomyces sp. ACA25]
MRDDFGFSTDGAPIGRHVLTAPGIRARVLDYGCVIQSLEVPDRRGHSADITLGFDSMADYATRSRYFGAVVGRFGNRIGNARFTLDGREYRLPANQGTNSLHGGEHGFDKRVWEVTEAASDRLTLTHLSPDGEQGYPGTLRARVTYTVSGSAEGSELRIDYHATTDAPTHVNLTNHAYFNLAGGGDIHGHELTLDAGHYLPVDSRLLPTGELAPTAGTPFDFRTPRTVGERIGEDHEQLRTAGGYDHCFVFDSPAGALRPVGRVREAGSGRTMQVLTTEPGVQFYSGNMLKDAEYGEGAGLCLETQHFPDSPNRPEFPTTVLRPGEEYVSTTVYRFAVEREAGEESTQWP